jgi:hypothetical protein
MLLKAMLVSAALCVLDFAIRFPLVLLQEPTLLERCHTCNTLSMMTLCVGMWQSRANQHSFKLLQIMRA